MINGLAICIVLMIILWAAIHWMWVIICLWLKNYWADLTMALTNSLKWALWQHSKKKSYLSSVCQETSLHLEKILPQCACIQSLKPVSVKIWRLNVEMIPSQVMPYSWKLSTTLSNNEASESYKEAIDPAVTVPLCCFSMLLCFISMLSLSTVSKLDGSV